MKILLAPSESKSQGGEENFNINNLLFKRLSPIRTQILHKYINVLQQGDIPTLSKMFGIKKEKEILKYKKDIVYELTLKAIERYTGVAFEYLNYKILNNNQKEYIDNNVIIFSNLFGAIRAFDKIPSYKLKQGEEIGDIKPYAFYKIHSSNLLDEYLKDEEILDLRAGFYDKFYKPSKSYTTLKFIKNGKVVSHWAKAYRGIVLREIALANIKNLDTFSKLKIKNLIFKEKKITKNKTELIYEIIGD